MNVMERIVNILIGVFLICMCLLMALVPETGYLLMALILTFLLLLAGIRYLLYYLTMARHMVGGKTILFYGIITLDVGLIALSFAGIPEFYLLYLLIYYGFTGAIQLLRALEAKKYGASSWRLNLVTGIINVAVAVLCICFIRSTTAALYVFCVGLFYSACVRIVTAFRRTTVVYIQ